MDPVVEVRTLVDHLFRHHASAILSGLSRRLGLEHLDVAEEVVQEAMLRALRLWPYHGIPANPRAWLSAVARNKALEVIRRRGVFREKWPEMGRLAALEADLADLDEPPGDEGLAMIFACNHPALPPEGRVALTLHAACGFSVPEIARAFLAQEPTIAQRIVRAKRLIRDRRVTLELPGPEMLASRLESVLRVIYLLFNEGYSAHAGDALIRQDLCGEAIWLAGRLLDRPETAWPRCHALLALILIQASRLPARQDGAGDLILLRDQDRSLWDERLIHRGLHHLGLASEGDDLTAYHLQAGIAATHAIASSHATTDWDRMLALYTTLVEIDASPIVGLNRAVALAMMAGPAAGLAAIDETGIATALDGYFSLHATRADLLRQLGDLERARASYLSALRLPCTGPEQRFLQRRLDEMDER